MGFIEAIRTCLQKYVGFSGRARRSEFWFFMLFGIIVGVVSQGIDVAAFGTDPIDNRETGPIEALTSLLLFLPSLAVSVRRLHDIGKSGWWVLINLIPIIGWIISLIWAIRDSQPGMNQHGPNPKGVSGPQDWGNPYAQAAGQYPVGAPAAPYGSQSYGSQPYGGQPYGQAPTTQPTTYPAPAPQGTPYPPAPPQPGQYVAPSEPGQYGAAPQPGSMPPPPPGYQQGQQPGQYNG